MAHARSWIHRMLLATAQGEVGGGAIPEAGAGADWQRLAEVAGAHGMQGLVASALRRRSDVPADFQVPLQAAALRIAGNHRRLLESATNALALLRHAGVEGLVVKGPILVERYYPDSSSRPYGDVDLVVHPGRLRLALETLEDGGYVLTDRNWEFLVSDLRGQVHVTGPSGSVVELHWHLVNGSRQRRALRMGPSEMWDVAVPARLADATCLALPAEEEVAHLALHAAMHGCNRLIWLVDLAAIARVRELDWDVTIRRLRSWGFGTGGGLVLMLAADWAGAAIPPDVLRELVGRRTARRAYSWFTRRWDLQNVVAGAHPRGLFFATAADRVGTALALAADAVVPAPGQQPDGRPTRLHRLTVGTARRVRRKLSGHGDAGSEYLGVGDPEGGRRRFLEAVERSAAV